MICWASCGRVFCRRRAASGARGIAPASWHSSTSASRAGSPVGFGQARRGYVVTCELPYARAFAGALVFSKEFPDTSIS
jgi:hypothetical protein